MDDDTEATDPWSREVPVTDAPTKFDFPSRAPADDVHSAPSIAGGSSGASTSEHAGRPEQVASPTSRPRRGSWVAAGVAVLALLVAGVAVLSRRDANDEPTDDSATAAESTPSTTDLPFERTTTAPRPTTTAPAAPRTTPLATVATRPPEWVASQIAVPETVAQIDDGAELVAMTTGGKVLRITLADGTTSTLDLETRYSNGQLHLGSSSILLTDNGGSTRQPTLIVEGGPPIQVDTDGEQLQVVGRGPGPDDFRGYTWNPSNGRERIVIIGADGSIVETDDNGGSPWLQGYVDSTSERWLIDAGGIYLVADNGDTRRISTGVLVASNREKFLVRECDERRQCKHLVVDAITDERTPALLPDDLQVIGGPVQFSSLSPDGTVGLVVYWNDREASLVDLSTGSVTALDLGFTDMGVEVAWAPDSSGFFTIDMGDIVFVDRAGSNQIEVEIPFDDTDTFADLDMRSAPGPTPVAP